MITQTFIAITHAQFICILLGETHNSDIIMTIMCIMIIIITTNHVHKGWSEFKVIDGTYCIHCAVSFSSSERPLREL